MAGRVNAPVNPQQRPPGHAPINLVVTQTQLAKLVPQDGPMLPPQQRREPGIEGCLT